MSQNNDSSDKINARMNAEYEAKKDLEKTILQLITDVQSITNKRS